MKAFLRIITASVAVLTCLTVSPPLSAKALPIIQGTYKLPASLDATVTSSLQTELWAEVTRPATGGPYPLVVFLHGNHGTCGHIDSSSGIRIDDRIDYTSTGTCPAGYVVTPNHLGYRYLATPLAKFGYVVVSINANRGVTAAPGESGDFGLNLRRGRLVLRHLQQLAAWNSTGGAPASLGFDLQGLIDFTQVGLMGHSRGGEGVRAAVAQYLDPGSPWPARIGPVTFRSMYEIGPVDGQTSRILNAVNLDWNVILPGCDGDVSDLQGVKPLDRMLKITSEKQPYNKSSFQVFGANHNFYNTEWQESDAFSCLGQTAIFPQTVGSPQQRTTAAETLIPFFRAHLGLTPTSSLARRFDPSYPLPTALTAVTGYARGFTPAPRASDNFVIDDFDKATGISSRNVANQSSGLTQYIHGAASANHDATQRAAAVNWSSLGGFLQVNAATGLGVDISRYRSLEFRVALRCFGSLCSSAPDLTGNVDFSIKLASGNATFSTPIALKSRAVVRRPAGSFSNNVILQTVRIPLTAFSGADLVHFRGVRFTFDKVASSSIFLSNVRLTKAKAADTVLAASTATEPQPAGQASSDAIASTVSESDSNEIVAIRKATGAASAMSGVPAGNVEIEVASSRPFPVSGSLPVLTIGNHNYQLSRFATNTTERLIFTLDEAEFNTLTDGTEVDVRIGGAPVWNFGFLNKSIAK